MKSSSLLPALLCLSGCLFTSGSEEVPDVGSNGGDAAGLNSQNVAPNNVTANNGEPNNPPNNVVPGNNVVQPNADPGPCGPCSACEACDEQSGLCVEFACEPMSPCHAASCESGTCVQRLADGCLIDGECVAPGTRNPDNPCMACAPDLDATTWSPADGACPPQECWMGGACIDGACQPAGFLDDGTPCAGGLCASGKCEQPMACVIDQNTWNPTELNPGNSCEECAPDRSATDWSPRAGGSLCDDNLPEVACHVARCNAEGGCRFVVDPTQEDLPCSRSVNCANGDVTVCDNGLCHCRLNQMCVTSQGTFQPGFLNPNNPCSWCDPHIAASGFAQRPDNTSCLTPGGAEGRCLNATCVAF